MTKMRSAVLIVFIVLLVGGIGIFLYTQNDSAHLNELTFSNTMEWGEEYLTHLNRQFYFESLEGWEESISLSTPPSNSSRETRNELDDLLTLQKARTNAEVQQTVREIHISNFPYDGETLEEIGSERPVTTRLLDEALRDLARIVIAEKRNFDRVRPHFLDERLIPAIDVPEHAAYPSGHSTQAHFIAGILSLLNPPKEEVYFEDAAQIALNREIVGVHYASDSEIGRILAAQVLGLLKDDPKFIELVAEAKNEWK